MISQQIDSAESVEQTAEIPQEETKPFVIWEMGKFREHFVSNDQNDLLDPQEMPDALDMGTPFIQHTQDLVGKCIDAYYGEPRAPLFRSMAFAPNRCKITDDRSMRLLTYKAGDSVALDVKDCFPPRPEFLMPVLSYTEFMAGRARALTLASDELIMLFMRTNKTYLLTGKIEPRDVAEMKMPYDFKDIMEQSMGKFLTGCKEANLAIYARRTFPVNLTEWESSLLIRIV